MLPVPISQNTLEFRAFARCNQAEATRSCLRYHTIEETLKLRADERRKKPKNSITSFITMFLKLMSTKESPPIKKD
jgi:hypothetical protein